MLSCLLFISSIGFLPLTSPSALHEHLPVEGFVSDIGDVDGYMVPSAGGDKNLRDRTLTDGSGMSTPTGSSEEAENLTDVCGSRDWILDYFILREGYDDSCDMNSMLDWLCQDSVGSPVRADSYRHVIIQILNTMEESVDDVVYSYQDALRDLDDESVKITIKGGFIPRHDALETIKLAVEILMHNSSPRLSRPEIALRENVALYLAVHAGEFGARYEWVWSYCSERDPSDPSDSPDPGEILPLSLSKHRTPGTDYGSNINFFAILEAFKNLEGGSPKKTIEGIEEYIHERRYIVKGNWEMVYALDELIGSVNDFVENIEKFEGVASELERSLKYFNDSEEGIFMIGH
jgi:hypothetical protein